MAQRCFAAAFALALLVPLLEASVPGLTLARGSLAALALLPWLALAPLPRSSGARAPLGAAPAAAAFPALREALYVGALALPPLALGAGLDLARGADARVLSATGAGGWLLLVLWVGAAAHAARTTRAQAAFAWSWFVLLPGVAALRLALAWVPLRAGGAASELGPERARWLALDPLVWCHRWGRAGGLEQTAALELALALGAALGVLLAVHALARASPEPGA